VIVAFVDEHRDEFGVEFICRHLQVAPSTYYAAKHRQAEPSARAKRDAVLLPILLTLWIANRKVYGVHKLWKAARRAGHDIGRDQVARLMRELGIEGVARLRKKVFTTRQDPDAARAPDLVNRNFKATTPNQLWVTDLTYVPTRSGMAYVCFIVDAFSRRIVGWRVATNMKTDMVLDALEMARASRGARRLIGLVTHSDAGSQFTSVRFTERLEEIGARPSIGTVADSYDNALAETTNEASLCQGLVGRGSWARLAGPPCRRRERGHRVGCRVREVTCPKSRPCQDARPVTLDAESFLGGLPGPRRFSGWSCGCRRRGLDG